MQTKGFAYHLQGSVPDAGLAWNLVFWRQTVHCGGLERLGNLQERVFVEITVGHDFELYLGARLSGRTTARPSKKGSEKGVLSFSGFAGGSHKVLRRCLVVSFKRQKGFSQGVLGRGVSRRCSGSPVGEYKPLGVCPIYSRFKNTGRVGKAPFVHDLCTFWTCHLHHLGLAAFSRSFLLSLFCRVSPHQKTWLRVTSLNWLVLLQKLQFLRFILDKDLLSGRLKCFKSHPASRIILRESVP